MTNFEMIRPLRQQLRINKTITLVDDSSNHILTSAQVSTYMQHLYDHQTEQNKVVLWGGVNTLKPMVSGF